ncbi:MAG: YihY/virulence factor BrkB family protein [Xanthobacteraceae bacterium]
MRLIFMGFRAAVAAFHRFNADDGWAIASHIALSTLMALFPFLIVLGSLARFLGANEIADDVVGLMFETWPDEVADRIGSEIHAVLTTNRRDLLTINLVLAIYFASSGVESLRIGLNRAYGVAEPRNWFILRLESIIYVLITLAALLALGFLIVLGPLLFATAVEYAPWLAPLEARITLARYAVATLVLVVALVLVHTWLPAGRRTLFEIMPGVVATLLLWLLCGIIFGRYLAQFAQAYVTYYSGLSSAMIALVFLYFTALIFVFGGEFNHAMHELRGKASS